MLECRFRVAVLLVCVLGLSGCKSPEGPGSDSLAAVEIEGHSFLEVARTTSQVFQKAGFTPAPLPPSKEEQRKLVFERPGTGGDSLLYGDWSGGTIWYRAKVTFTEMGPDKQLVRCDAYRVLEKGSRHFEEEHKLSRMKAGAYQKLLDQVKTTLQPK